MLNRFLAFISGKHMVRSVRPWLLAVSGGADSVCLADLCKKAGISFGIAHCNFGLRNNESDGDELFVQQLAANYDVPFFSKRFETEAFAAQEKISIQQAARKLRYDWLEDIRSTHGFVCIATAHHLSDITETMLINQLRGTGIEGLHGIRAVRGNIIRPLLFASRAEIREYVAAHKLVFREDSSNATDKYLRNALRHHVVPQLLQIEPDTEKIFADNAARISSFEQLAKALIAEQWQQMTEQKADGLHIRISLLKQRFDDSTLREEFLYQVLKPFGFNADNAAVAAGMLESQAGKQVFSATHSVLRDRESLIISDIRTTHDEPIEITALPAQHTEVAGLHFELLDRATLNTVNAKPSEAYISSERLQFPLIIRRWQPGDTMQPFGMKGRKKVSDILIDNKVPLSVKKDIRVLVSAERIVWLIGIRTDNHFRITDDTASVLKITASGLYSPEYQL